MSGTMDEILLHAYVDDQLDGTRRAEVEAWLAAHPEAAARVLAYQLQNERLHEHFDALLAEPLPPAWLERPGKAPFWRVDRRLFAWPALAASLLLAVAAGWFAHAGWQGALPGRDQPLYRQAAVAHAVFVPDARRPVEVEQEAALVKWLSRRLGTDVRVPDLRAQGYELVGGRLLPGQHGAVAQFMYQETSGQRLTLYLSREGAGQGGSGFRFAREGSINVFYWIDGNFGYALSGEISRPLLGEVAKAVYDQLPVSR